MATEAPHRCCQGACLGQGLLEDPGEAEGQVVAVPRDGDLEADREAVLGQPRGDRDGRVPTEVGEHRERGGHGAAGRWALRREGRHRGGGGEQHVDLAEEPGGIEGELLAAPHRAGVLRQRVVLRLVE